MCHMSQTALHIHAGDCHLRDSLCAVFVPGSSASIFLSQTCVYPSSCDCAVGRLMFLPRTVCYTRFILA